MVDATVAEFGKVDILVANAGMDIKKPLILVDAQAPVRMRANAHFDSCLLEEEWETMLDINLKGYVRCAVAVGHHMIKQRSGRIIGIGSVAGMMAGDIGTIYAASKAGVHQFSGALSREWAPFNITVNCIAPGAFGTTESWYVPSWNISREEHEESFKRVVRSVPYDLYRKGTGLGNFVLGEGEEAIPVAICANLRSDDSFKPNFRQTPSIFAKEGYDLSDVFSGSLFDAERGYIGFSLAFGGGCRTVYRCRLVRPDAEVRSGLRLRVRRRNRKQGCHP